MYNDEDNKKMDCIGKTSMLFFLIRFHDGIFDIVKDGALNKMRNKAVFGGCMFPCNVLFKSSKYFINYITYIVFY